MIWHHQQNEADILLGSVTLMEIMTLAFQQLHAEMTL